MPGTTRPGPGEAPAERGCHDGGMANDLWFTGDPEADTLLSTDPFALLIGMLLDQQVTMESEIGRAHV